MVIALTGSSGLIGTHFRAVAEANGHAVVPIRRTGSASSPHWNLNEASLRRPDVILHLAGENLASHKWNEAQKTRILESRVVGTQRLCEKVSHMANPPRLFACASAVGIYGDRGDTWVDEESATGEGFLAEVCQEWEKASTSMLGMGMRVTNFRFGMVLDPAGGALARMLPFFRSGLGGPIGDGTQWMSWISSHDAAAAMLFAFDHPTLDGPVNIVSPAPVQNADFAKQLGESLQTKARFRVPKFVANLAFGEMGRELLFPSIRAQPLKLVRAGYPFAHPELTQALDAFWGAETD